MIKYTSAECLTGHTSRTRITTEVCTSFPLVEQQINFNFSNRWGSGAAGSIGKRGSNVNPYKICIYGFSHHIWFIYTFSFNAKWRMGISTNDILNRPAAWQIHNSFKSIDNRTSSLRSIRWIKFAAQWSIGGDNLFKSIIKFTLKLSNFNLN